MSVVRTERLTKRYGSRRGIEQVDLSLAQGEILGFVGPNGAGKTTMIRLLLDLIRPTSGRAWVFGIETTADPAAIHRRTGYLPGDFALYDRLTGGETLEHFARLRGGVDAAYQARLIERLDLDPSRPFREYSRGNRQKVGIAIALQHQPDLLVLDEPTAGLDPLVQQTFFALLRERTDAGATVFLSSHILAEVERTCDRVALIREGRIILEDRVATLRALADRTVTLRFPAPVAAEAAALVPGVRGAIATGTELRLQVHGALGPVLGFAAAHGATDLSDHVPSLEETLLARYAATAGAESVGGAPTGGAPDAR